MGGCASTCKYTCPSLLYCCIGLLSGHKVVGVRMVLEDGVSHAVDSSETAFRLAAVGAMRQGKSKAMVSAKALIIGQCLKILLCFIISIS